MTFDDDAQRPCAPLAGWETLLGGTHVTPAQDRVRICKPLDKKEQDEKPDFTLSEKLLQEAALAKERNHKAWEINSRYRTSLVKKREAELMRCRIALHVNELTDGAHMTTSDIAAMFSLTLDNTRDHIRLLVKQNRIAGEKTGTRGVWRVWALPKP